jgi:hypothetical protein
MKSPLGDASNIEFGLVGRIAYEIKEFQVNVGYFGALTPYDHIEQIRATLYNQNWSIGLSRYVR